MSEAERIIAALALEPHPEGGWYRQTWAAPAQAGERPAGTCIYFLLRAGERSRWHSVDADEIWHFYAGAPLTLSIAEKSVGPVFDIALGSDPFGQRIVHQAVVPQGWWQAAQSTGEWSLVGCTESPGFTFEGFRMLPPGAEIPKEG